jgi:hypothetical protein
MTQHLPNEITLQLPVESDNHTEIMLQKTIHGQTEIVKFMDDN